ncbi:diguanylate cyclase domain-containing protein [Rhodoferax sp.]|uniref:GGDEF domain-containing protein n=1 Tax=Rhodoferax sp. TaxID=50421 RepID=UPI00374D46BF
MLTRFSLRQWLTLPYVALVLGVATLVGVLSYRTGSEVVDTLSRHLLLEMVARIEQAVDRHLVGSAAVLETAFPRGVGTTDDVQDDAAALRTRFWAATALYTDPNNYVYYGNEAGQVAAMYRHSPTHAEWRLRRAIGAPRQSYTIHSIDAALDEPQYLYTPLDPRTRPWYAQARTSKSLVWTAVYIDAVTDDLVVTRAKRITTTGDRLQGVVATDVALHHLNDFVRTLALSSNGLAFIIEANGQLIASSRTPNTRSIDHQGNTRINALDSGEPLQAAAYRSVREALQTGVPLDTPVSQRITGPDGAAVQLAFSRMHDDAGLDWLVVVAVPRSDFMQGVTSNVLRTAAIGAAAALAAVAIGLLILNWLSADLQRLAVAARRVGEGRLDPVLDVKGRGTIGELTRSFREMQLRLRTDTLTGLHNREWLVRSITERIARARRQDAPLPFALLFIDLDKFKQINDSLGHDAGDRVLVDTAQRLRQATRSSDTVARYAGDEFVVLLDPVADAAVAEQIRDKIDRALRRPEGVAPDEAVFSASVGLAVYMDPAMDAEDLIRLADEDMYRRKSRGDGVTATSSSSG